MLNEAAINAVKDQNGKCTSSPLQVHLSCLYISDSNIILWTQWRETLNENLMGPQGIHFKSEGLCASTVVSSQ